MSKDIHDTIDYKKKKQKKTIANTNILMQCLILPSYMTYYVMWIYEDLDNISKSANPVLSINV